MYFKYFKPFPVLETERLVLRKLKKSDYSDLYEYCSDPISCRFSDWEIHSDENVTKQFIKGQLSLERRGEYFIWCIELKESSKVIGTVSITDIDRHFKVAELGYGIQKKYWGNGYATEAVEALVDYMFCTVGVQRLCARIVTSNLTSVRLATRLNMECDGLLRKGVYLKDKAHDVYVYSITDTDYVRILKSKEQASEESCQQAENEVEE